MKTGLSVHVIKGSYLKLMDQQQMSSHIHLGPSLKMFPCLAHLLFHNVTEISSSQASFIFWALHRITYLGSKRSSKLYGEDPPLELHALIVLTFNFASLAIGISLSICAGIFLTVMLGFLLMSSAQVKLVQR